jgi:plasmid stabilization system protein ParE
MDNNQDTWLPPVYLDKCDPEIHHPAAPAKPHQWRAANNASIKLLPCIEALRDIERLFRDLAETEDPSADAQLVKLIATPIYNLGVAVTVLFNEFLGNAREYQGRLDTNERKHIQARLNDLEQKVDLRGGPLKKVRDKLSSHIDRDVFRPGEETIWRLIELRPFLLDLREIGDALHYLLRHDVFAWTREDADPAVFRLMSVDGTEVHLQMEKNIIVAVTIAKSPKSLVSVQIQRVAHDWARIMERLSALNK